MAFEHGGAAVVIHLEMHAETFGRVSCQGVSDFTNLLPFVGEVEVGLPVYFPVAHSCLCSACLWVVIRCRLFRYVLRRWASVGG